MGLGSCFSINQSMAFSFGTVAVVALFDEGPCSAVQWSCRTWYRYVRRNVRETQRDTYTHSRLTGRQIHTERERAKERCIRRRALVAHWRRVKLEEETSASKAIPGDRASS